jgi:acyl carrier protein
MIDRETATAIVFAAAHEELRVPGTVIDADTPLFRHDSAFDSLSAASVTLDVERALESKGIDARLPQAYLTLGDLIDAIAD